MALIDMTAGSVSDTAPNAWQDQCEVDVRLRSLQAAIQRARRNGWRESDQLGDEMERYLAAVQPELPSGERRPIVLANPSGRTNSWRG